MARRESFTFQHVRTVGPMLPAGVLELVAGFGKLPGLRPEDYRLAKGDRLNEAITRDFLALTPSWNEFSREATARLANRRLKDPARVFVMEVLGKLGYAPGAFAVEEIDGRRFEITNRWLHVPIHVVDSDVKLERVGEAGAGGPRVTPHDLVQSYLNRSEDALWGMLCNGHSLRLVRDNRSVTRPAFVEFDLDGIFSAQSYADFRLLWLVCHSSRLSLPVHEGQLGQPHETILEQWHTQGLESGKRVLNNLRESVRDAIAALGRGFLVPAGNQFLRDHIASAATHKSEYYRQLLRMVYRLLFLMAAESRGVLHAPEVPAEARETYRRHYSLDRIRRLAGSTRGGHQTDLFEGLKLVMRALGGSVPVPELGLSPLGGFLWSAEAIGHLEHAAIRNRDLLDAVRAIAFTHEDNARVPIDYKNLGSEELGSVYEQLLELHPEIDPMSIDESRRFALETNAGNDRKTSGSYYTPSSLVQCLLDSALEPVMNDRVAGLRGKAAAEALLGLKVCDPAVGSGHFLIAAAHRLAARVATYRTGEEQPGESAHRAALRDVIRRCLYGIDINPMSAELCKVALWMESLEPGKPLSFLDSHIRVGNSLIGATPELMAEGIPDDAFGVLEGDDSRVCTALKRRNKEERTERKQGQGLLGYGGESESTLADDFAELSAGDDQTVDDVRRRAETYGELVASDAYANAKFAADAWCAAFFWKKDGTQIGGIMGITEATFREIEAHPERFGADHPIRKEVDRLANEHKFLHLHLVFPEVFGPSAEGGVVPAPVGGSC
jgi:hypothetical protein